MTASPLASVLTLWTIYDRPRDYPRHVVVRAHHLDTTRGTSRPAGSAMLFRDLEQARDAMRHRGLSCIDRDPSDDPVIVESWL